MRPRSHDGSAGSNRLLHVAAQADLADDPQIGALIAAASHSSNPRLQHAVQAAITTAAAQHQQYPFDVPDRMYPLATVPRPAELDVGTVLETSRRVTIPLADLPRHLLAAGMTGAGKTTFIYQLVSELPVDVSWWAFDLKTDYRHLATSNAVGDVLVIPWEQFRLNPLRPPPGVTVQRWLQLVQAVFGDAYDLLSGSQHYLLPELLACFDQHGIAPTARGDQLSDDVPTLHGFRQYVAEDGETGRSQSTYKDRLDSRLRALTAATDPLFACHRGYALTDLLEQNVVLELDGLAPDHQDFVMELLLTWVYAYRQAQQHRSQGCEHVWILDEGKRAFSAYKEQQAAQGIPTIDTVLAKLREFGEAMIVGDQEPDKLTASLQANTATKVLFPVGDASQRQTMARAMGLSDTQTAYAADLAVGQAVVKQGTQAPVPVQFHHQQVAKTVTDAEVHARYQDVWKQLGEAMIPASETAMVSPTTDVVSSPGVEAGEAVEDLADTAAALPDPAELELSEAADWLFRDIVTHPFKPVTDRYADLDSDYAGDKAQKELVAQQLVAPEQVTVGRGRVKLFDLTARGRAYADAHDIAIDWTGRGGIVHQFYQSKIASLIESAGGSAQREHRDADVYASVEDEVVAIEVAMGNNRREVEHIEKHLSQGFDRVVVACRSPSVRRKLRERLQAREEFTTMNRVGFRLVQDFLATESPPL